MPRTSGGDVAVDSSHDTSAEELLAHPAVGPQIVYSYDADGICTMSEGPGLALIGLQPGQLVGVDLLTLYQDDRKALDPLLRVLQGETFHYEQEFAGRVLWSYHQALFDESGQVVGGLGIVTDVTEQRENERAAEAHRRRTAALVRLAPALARDVPDLRALQLTAVRMATESVGEVGALWLVSDDGDHLDLHAWHLGGPSGGVSQWHHDVAEPLLIPRSSAEGFARVQRIDLQTEAATGNVFGSEQIAQWVADSGAIEAIRVVMRARGALIGVLDVARTEALGPFNDDDVELLVEMADRIALVIDNARLLKRHADTVEQTIRLRALADASDELIAIADEDGRFLYVNPRLDAWLGGLDQDSDTWTELAKRVDPLAAGELQESLMTTGRWSGDLHVDRGEHGTSIVQTEVFAIGLPSTGEPAGIAWMGRDVTDLRGMVTTLSELNKDLEQFKALVDTSPDFIAIAGVDGTVSYLNPAGRRLVRLPVDVDVTRTHIGDYLTPEGLALSVESEQESVIAHGHWEGESTLRDWAGGPPIPVAVSSFLVSDPSSGQPTALATVQRDLRDRRAAERARRDLAEQREALLARLVKAQEVERSRIAADVHDDSVQALAAVDLRLSMLVQRLRDRAPDLVEVLVPVQQSVSAASDRLRALLFDLEPPELDRGVGPALRAAAREIFDETDTEVSLRADDEPDISQAQRAVAYRIAKEAMINARKHAAARHLDLTLRPVDNGLELTVEDDGQGIGDVGPGVGHLGMSSMQDRAAVAGGRLEVRSFPGEGTSVLLWLPGYGGLPE